MSSKWKNHKKKKVARIDLIRDFNYHNMELEESGLYGLDDPVDATAGVETMTGIEAMEGDIDFSEDYDTKPAENIVPEEQHILFGESAIDEETKEKAKEDAAKKEPPYDPKKVIKSKPPNFAKSVREYKKKKSGNNFRQIILDLIDAIPNTLNYCVEYAMYHYCYFAFKDSKDWPAYEQAHATACATIMKMITVPIAAIIVGNWWYLLNYTDFYIDTDKIFDTFPLSSLYYIIQPTSKIIGGINNFLQKRRLSAETPNSERNFYKNLWDYRPITITLFFLFVFSMVGSTNFNDVMRSAVLGTPNPIFYSIIGISIILYIALFLSENGVSLLGKTGSVILVAIFFLVCLIGVILFSFLGVFIVFYYFIFFSFFFLFIYNYGNIFEVMRIGKQIHTDLIFSKPFFKDTTGSVFKKVANHIIQNLFVLFTQSAGVGIAFYGYLKNAAELKSKSTKAVNMMRLFYGALGMYGGYNIYKLFKNIYRDITSTIAKSREEVLREINAALGTESSGLNNPLQEATQ